MGSPSPFGMIPCVIHREPPVLPPCLKKTTHLVYRPYLCQGPDINQFSKFFHWHTHWTIRNKVLGRDD